MPREMFSDVVSVVLAKALDGTAARHRTLANNISNVDTPGYKRSDVSFHDRLKAALSPTREKGSILNELERVRPQRTVDRTRSLRADGNTVSIETEMGEMAKNTLEYESDVQLLLGKIRMLHTAISEGRK